MRTTFFATGLLAVCLAATFSQAQEVVAVKTYRLMDVMTDAQWSTFEANQRRAAEEHRKLKAELARLDAEYERTGDKSYYYKSIGVAAEISDIAKWYNNRERLVARKITVRLVYDPNHALQQTARLQDEESIQEFLNRNRGLFDSTIEITVAYDLKQVA